MVAREIFPFATVTKKLKTALFVLFSRIFYIPNLILKKMCLEHIEHPQSFSSVIFLKGKIFFKIGTHVAKE